MRSWRWLVSVVLLGAMLAQVGGWMAAARSAAQMEPDPQTERLFPAGHLGGAVTQIELLEDDYAVLALGVDLLILDILNPLQPVQVGRLSFHEQISKMLVYGNNAYVLVKGQVHLVDLRDRTRPRDSGALPPVGVNDIDRDENYLYVGGREGIGIYSLGDPAAPGLIGYSRIENTYRLLAIYPYLTGGYQYSCSDEKYTYTCTSDLLLDISQPAHPVRLEANANKVGIISQYLPFEAYFIVLGAGSWELPGREITIYTGDPTALLSWEKEFTLAYRGQDIWLQGDRLYIAGGEVGLRIVDLSDPLSPVELGTDNTLPEARQIVVQDNVAFVIDGSAELGIFDVRDPADPGYRGQFRSAGVADWLLLDGERLYASSDQMEIIDVSDRQNPQVLGSYPEPGRAAVNGDLLFLAAGEHGLIVLEISDPAAPRELDRLAGVGEAVDVALSGDYAFVITCSQRWDENTCDGQMLVIDIHDPADMAVVGTAAGRNLLQIVAGVGFVGLISNVSWGNAGNLIHIYDVTVPASPELVFEFRFSGSDVLGVDWNMCDWCGARDIATDGERLFVVWDYYYTDIFWTTIGASGLLVFEQDLSLGWELEYEHSLVEDDERLFRIIMDVSVSSGTGYVLGKVGWNMKLWLFDVDNPVHPYSQNTYELSGSQSDSRLGGLAAQGDLVAVGKYEAGIHLLDWWPAGVFQAVMYLPVVHHP